MAVWKFTPVSGVSQGTEELFENTSVLPDFTFSSSSMRLSGASGSAAGLVTKFSGSGITATGDVITAGTITKATFKIFGDLALKATGLKLDAAQLADRFDDSFELASYMFRGADEITGTSLGEDIFGFGGKDTLFGLGGNDMIAGGFSDDRLYGGGGRDVLYGEEGNNTVSGGAGRDTIYSEDGNDRILFNTAPVSSQYDYVQDFDSTNDLILLDSDVFTKAGPVGGLAAGRFHIGTAAGDAGDRIIYDDNSGLLYYDPDGTGAKAQRAIAELVDDPVLTAADIRIIG